jgi:hypothetical protein
MWQLIRQTDHAALAGELAKHWGRPPFDLPEPFDAVVCAAAQHDNGWTDWDARPKINPVTQQPYQFWELPVEEHLSFYFQGVEKVVGIDRYAGLLASMHCAGLYNGRYGTDPALMVRQFTPEMQRTIQGFLDRLKAQQHRLREELRTSNLFAAWLEDGKIWKNYRLLQIFDRLSLYLCMLPLGQRSLRPVPVAAGEDVELVLQPHERNEVHISPYPFDVDPLEVTIDCRLIPQTSYGGDDQFRAVLAGAEVTALTFELIRG